VQRLYRAKGRGGQQPTALVAADFEALLECVPELTGRAEVVAGALLPGAYTLILPNPARRFPWLAGTRPDAIGVRIPAATGPGAEVLSAVGARAAPSANQPGAPDPRRLDDVPEQLRAAVAALVDGGELPGTPSTVLDLTGAQPVVVREGAVPAAEALRVVASVL
jgi:L-threonylcarbamoyladenylate synthase